MEAAGAASPPTEPPMTHPAVAPLAFLLGKWRGEGEGSFPTISSFRYGEELLFSHHPSKVWRLPTCVVSLAINLPFGCPILGAFSLTLRIGGGWLQPVISYTQKTWKPASGEPMHAESGYWRPRPDGSVDVVIAQSTGLAEVQVSSSGQLASSLQA
jgi:hypothetical protein